MLKGTGASDGIGIGRVMLIEETSLEYTPKAVKDPDEESKRFRNAVKIFCDNTKAQADALRESTGEKEAEILEGHIQMISDPYLSSEIEKLISDGQCAESALEHMCDMFITMFTATDDEITQQRAADVRDVKSGVLCILLGVKEIK
ncbi:MAG: phosphoenolpyruvate-utilizing N-terminal domain-containing protein, partial [Ruminococcus sp.]|nr:phosphoenolpyruvate-utilizing N-terminal domain-containing protein [Ruminococcus sp.]